MVAVMSPRTLSRGKDWLRDLHLDCHSRNLAQL